MPVGQGHCLSPFQQRARKSQAGPSGGCGHRPLGHCSRPLKPLPGLQRAGLVVVRLS